MSTNDGQAHQRLAHAVLSRRTELGFSQIDVWRRGGPSNTTLTNIENGRQERLSNTTARRLDKGLMWMPGSAMGIWTKAEPPEPIKTVGGDPQDAGGAKEAHVNAPGGRVEAGITNEDLLREILRSRAEYDQVRAEQRELSERVARLEQRGT